VVVVFPCGGGKLNQPNPYSNYLFYYGKRLTTYRNGETPKLIGKTKV
jgi:hypothetical protein